VTELDRAAVDRALPPASGSADWDDVLTRAGARRSVRRVVAFAAAVAVAVVGASAVFATRALLDDRGFIGLPPERAIPSAPTLGRLVASYWIVTGDTLSNPRRVKAWLYADGRLIWQRENDPRLPRPPEAANRWSSGLVEQRLTRTGVDRLRSEIVASGLFDRELTLILGDDEPCLSFIQVRRGGTLTALRWTGGQCAVHDARPATSRHARAVTRLKAQLADPAAWLPAGAWKQQRFRAFVPSRFAIGFWSTGGSRELSEILAPLPRPAQEALRGLSWREGIVGPTAPVTTNQARQLDKALAAAGLIRKRGAFVLSYRFENEATGETLSLTLGPLLPHGEEPGYGG
jgi:hypothetical protein